MKYCTKCGQECMDEEEICPNCGCALESKTIEKEVKRTSELKTAIKALMIVGTIMQGILGYLIPLCWCIPMTISYCNKVKKGEPVSTKLKICTILFVSGLAGVLMLFDKD